MADFKRNMIELVKEVKEGEIITEKYWTPVFMPTSVVYEAIDLMEVLSKGKSKEREMIDKLGDFVSKEVYKGQFTKDELMNGLHAPDAIQTLQDQILFVTQGQQTNETKEYLAKKR